jgi:hypothetical protein
MNIFREATILQIAIDRLRVEENMAGGCSINPIEWPSMSSEKYESKACR